MISVLGGGSGGSGGGTSATSAQVTSLVVTCETATFQGNSFGRYDVTFTAPVDLNFSYASIQRIVCDSTYTPLSGATWQEIAQLTASNNLDWFPLPNAVQYWVVQAESVNFVGVVSSTSPPSCNLVVPANSGSTTTAVEPTQPTTGDFSVTVASYDVDPQIGASTATLTCTITINPSDVTRFTVWSYPGTTPPTDPLSSYVDVADLGKALTGNTVMHWTVPRTDVTTNYQIGLTASNEVWAQYPDSTMPVHSISVGTISSLPQPTSFSVTCETLVFSGVNYGRYDVSFTPPNSTTYPNFNYVSIERILCNSSYTPTGSWEEIAQISVSTNLAYFPLPNAPLYYKVRGFTVTQTLDVNTTSPPTVNLMIPSNSGIDGGAIQIGSITANKIGSVNASTITGTITASQIGTVNASSITGTITASQIGTVNATSITGTITASQIGSVNATSISGPITASQITSIAASQITGNISASQIPVINASSITGGIAASQITAVNATSITGTVGASQISSVNASSITGSITAGQITSIAATQITGSIVATSIAAGSITGVIVTSQLAANILNTANLFSSGLFGSGITINGTAIQSSTQDTTNILSNPIFTFGGKDWIYTVGGTITTPVFATTGMMTGTQCLTIAWPLAAGNGLYTATNVPCKPGDQFTLESFVMTNSGATGQMYTWIRFLNIAGAVLADGPYAIMPPVPYQTPPTTWTSNKTTVSTAPPNASAMQVYAAWTGWGTPTMTGTWYIDNVTLRRVSNSSDISSVSAASITGSIAAVQIGSVNASSLIGLITAGQISSINATQIAGTIQASQIGTINASSISGTISGAQIGTINATSIAINSIDFSKISSVNAGTITTGSLNAITINLNLNNITTTISNAFDGTVGDYLGVLVKYNTNSQQTRISAGAIYLQNNGYGQISIDARTGQINMTDSGGTSAVWLNPNQNGSVNCKTLNCSTTVTAYGQIHTTSSMSADQGYYTGYNGIGAFNAPGGSATFSCQGYSGVTGGYLFGTHVVTIHGGIITLVS